MGFLPVIPVEEYPAYWDRVGWLCLVGGWAILAADVWGWYHHEDGWDFSWALLGCIALGWMWMARWIWFEVDAVIARETSD